MCDMCPKMIIMMGVRATEQLKQNGACVFYRSLWRRPVVPSVHVQACCLDLQPYRCWLRRLFASHRHRGWSWVGGRAVVQVVCDGLETGSLCVCCLLNSRIYFVYIPLLLSCHLHRWPETVYPMLHFCHCGWWLEWWQLAKFSKNFK